MTNQKFNFARDEYIGVSDSHVTEPAEINRLASQNDRILARLKRGPATARELAGISLNYRARISDARKAGYAIACDYHRNGGLSIYRLETK